jgi:hypothetical protein
MKFSTAYLPDKDQVYLALDKPVIALNRAEALQLAKELRRHGRRNPPMLVYLEVDGREATAEEISLYLDGKLTKSRRVTVSGDPDLLEQWIVHRMAKNAAGHGSWLGPCHGHGAKRIETAVETK